jgi:site-specific DNA recombinase
MRLAAVLRVSRVAGRQGASFISPDVQREQVEAYARAHGHTITAWHEDLDQPGSTLARPGLQAALAAVDAGDADGIIAAKLDRITRSIVDLGKLLQRARDGGWNLVAVDVGLDLGTPNGKLVAHVLGAIAEWELDRRRADWEESRGRAVARGVHVASKTPTGYRKRDDGRLEPDPETAPIIRELFELRADGAGWTELADHLTRTGVEGPYGARTWIAAAARKIVRNRVYLGEARSGRFVHPAAHEPLVDRATWEAAQRPRALPPARTREPMLLAGVVRCASCRYVMKADTMKDARGQRLELYRCRKRHAAGVCPAPTAVLARVLDPWVEEQLLEWAAGQDVVAEAQAATTELDRALELLDQADAELAAFAEGEAVTILGAQVFERGLRARRARVDDAQAAVLSARTNVASVGRLTSGDVVDAWPELTRAERRELVAAALDAVVVWPHRSGGPVSSWTLLVPRGDGPADLPRTGRRVELASWPADRPADVGVPPAEDL